MLTKYVYVYCFSLLAINEYQKRDSQQSMLIFLNIFGLCNSLLPSPTKHMSYLNERVGQALIRKIFLPKVKPYLYYSVNGPKSSNMICYIGIKFRPMISSSLWEDRVEKVSLNLPKVPPAAAFTASIPEESSQRIAALWHTITKLFWNPSKKNSKTNYRLFRNCTKYVLAHLMGFPPYSEMAHFYSTWSSVHV